MAETLAVIALLVSFASLAVSIIASVVLANRIKKQAQPARQPARQTTTLEPRARVINHLHEALFDIGNEGAVTSKTANSIHEAMHLSALVFSPEVRNGLDRAYVTAARLRKPPAGWTDQDTQDTIALAKDLQTLIARMRNEESELGG